MSNKKQTAKTTPKKAPKQKPIAAETDKTKKKKTIKIGKFEISSNLFEWIIVGILIAIYIVSPRYYAVTTALYNSGTEEDQKNVVTAMSEEDTEERFRLYFQWYNVLHELGHGLIYYNNGANINVADEEQLVNDFAVAYWKYYGEEEKVKELEDIANYAVEHIGDNYEKGVDYLKLGRENSSKKMFNKSFFNFNDYGWFQFSSVKHALETNKSLPEVLTEMGFSDFEIGSKKIHIYEEINETTSTQIINDAVENFRGWGLKYPQAIQHFNKDPNENSSKPVVRYLGLLEVPDFVCVVHNIIEMIF